ncbi:MAG: alkaline phosphatase family protein [Myxococcales bacterium]|nr:alkaline phosphatase family protein [Myxococcales bacterium]
MREWAASSIRRMGSRVSPVRSRRRRKLLLIHLDGVPRMLVAEAVRSGKMPFLSSLVRSGAYHLDSAFWGSPSSTPAFQAGLLYGLRHPNLPAYHWYDRQLGRIVRMNCPTDARAVEARLDLTARGSLLEGGGTAYLSLFQAYAQSPLCMTSLAHGGQMARALLQGLRGVSSARQRGTFAYLWALAEDTAWAVDDIFRWVEGLRDWRHEREYLLNRFFVISLGWGLAHSRTLVDMVRGVPAIYLVFGGFDEVAHRRGPFSEQAARELRRVDAEMEQLYSVARSLEEPYDVIFLTDHGHVDSQPLEQRIGKRLERYLVDGPRLPLPAEVERGLLDGRRLVPGGPVQYRDDPVVIEAGNFAHVYLSRGRSPLEAMELVRTHRDVLARAAALRDIGIVAVRRGASAAAIVGGGVYGPEEVDRAPMSAHFSRVAVADLLRELPHMGTAGDLVLFGEAHKPGGTVGFAWEFGSHGGLTHIETDSFVCWPADAPVDLSALGHVVRLHQRLSEAYRT